MGEVQTAHSKKTELFSPPGFLHEYHYTKSEKQHRVPTAFPDDKYRVHPIYFPCVLLDVTNENPLYQGSFSKSDVSANFDLERRKAPWVNQVGWIRFFKL